MKSKKLFLVNSFAIVIVLLAHEFHLHAQSAFSINISASNAQVITGWGAYADQNCNVNPRAPLAYDAMYNELGMTISRLRLWGAGLLDCGSGSNGNINIGDSATGLDHIYYVWNEARNRGVTDWYMSVWEAPAGMDSAGGFLYTASEKAFCNYVVNCLNYLINSKGMPVPKGFCIANEPGNTCMKTYAQMVRVTKAMRAEFNTCGIPNISSVPIVSNDAESFQTFGDWYGYVLNDTSYWNSVAINSCHSYYHAGTANPSGPDQFLSAINKYGPNKPRWMTEDCSATNPQPSQLLRAITMTRQLAHDINYCGFNMWMWWSVWDPGCSSTFGSINANNSNVLIDGDGITSIRRSKMFYVLSELWNSAKVGSAVHKVTSTDPLFKSSGGFFDDGAAFVYNGSTILLLINDSTIAKTYTINGLAGNSANVYQTTSSQDMALVSSPSVAGGTISGFNLPAESITIIITSVSTSAFNVDHVVDQGIEVYPNPASRSAIISYSLSENSNVKIVVYDVLGKKIENITEGKQTAGTYKLSFSTAGLQNGIYFIMATINGNEVTEKLMVSNN